MCGFYLNEPCCACCRATIRMRCSSTATASLAALSAGAAGVGAEGLREAAARRARVCSAPRARTASGAPIDPGRRYVYEPDRGPMPSRNSSSELSVSGQTLLDLAAGEYDRRKRDERACLRAHHGQRLHGCPAH